MWEKNFVGCAAGNSDDICSTAVDGSELYCDLPAMQILHEAVDNE